MKVSILYIFFLSLLLSVSPCSFAAFPVREQQKQEHTALSKRYRTLTEASIKNTSLYLNQVNPADDKEYVEKVDSGLLGSLAFGFGLAGIFPVAIILGILGMQRHRKNQGLAIAGLVLGILTIFLIIGVYLLLAYTY